MLKKDIKLKSATPMKMIKEIQPGKKIKQNFL